MGQRERTGHELEAEIVVKALRDPEFRQALEDNPKEAVAAELGISLPEELVVTLVEDSPDRLHFVLPYIDPEVVALTDDEQLKDILLGTCSKKLYEQALGTCTNTGTLVLTGR